MHIVVSGKQVDVGESLRSHVETRLQEGVSKYLERVIGITVVISRESHLFRVDISANPGTHSNIAIKSRGEAADVYAAFDLAATKIEKQLRRYKRRLTNHHKEADGSKTFRATKYVLADFEEEEEDAGGDAQPVIIAEKSTDIETLTVGAAVMKMDLSDLPALMFFNSAHGRLNIVYRRADGNISWVDPELQAAA